MSVLRVLELRALEALGILKETEPQPSCWRFEVLKPNELPEHLKKQYDEQGEVRYTW